MNRIKEIRKANKINQTEFAKKFNISQQTISNWENGITDIDTESLIAISNTYNLSIDYILGKTEDTKIKNIVPITGITKLPIIGTITAGYDGIAYQEDMGEIEVLDTALSGYAPEDCFVLQVKGNSMYPLFLDKDLVLVHKQSHVDSGTIAVVLYNGDEATVKKVIYKQGENWLDLVPTNPEYMTKHIENEDLELCHVIGKVISLVLRKI